jgi:hypothetical protein
MRTTVILLLTAAAVQMAHAADELLPDPAKQPPAIQEISPGVLQIGKVLLEKESRTVTFPGVLNMAEGSLEYLLVTPQGSTHESLLVSEAQPNDLHLAMLLLGAKGAGISTPAAEDAPPAQIDAEYLKTAPKLTGDAIHLTVKWKAKDGVEKTARVEEWLLMTNSKKAPAAGPWIYTGSMFRENHFLAQSEGIFAALVTNPSALINNPRAGNDNDQLWEVNSKVVPARDTSLLISIKLETPETSP